MDEDIEFALAVLKRDYDERRKMLVENDEFKAKDRDHVLAGLECLKSSIIKIEHKFSE